MSKLVFTVLTVSDTCSSGQNEDSSGPYLVEALERTFDAAKVTIHIIPDDMDVIEKCLIHYSDVCVSDLILTTGGTGFTKRDVTPEATRKVIQKEAPGIATALCLKSLETTQMAMLSRSVCGIRGNTLIINFPGSLKAVRECFDIVKSVLPHALNQLRGEACAVKLEHKKIVEENSSHDRHVCPHKKTDRDVTRVAYRQRESAYPMIQVHVALDLMKQNISLDFTSYKGVSVTDCVGFVLKEDVQAVEPFPPFPASIKDGYACLSLDCPRKLKVRGAIVAGEERNIPLKSGECIRISTGAPLPPIADCVVQVEDTKLISHSEDGRIEYVVEIMTKASPGQDVRQVGSDIQAGEVVLQAGSVIGPAELGLLHSLGLGAVQVYDRPVVGVLSTGSELQNICVGQLQPGHIRDSNRPMLLNLLSKYADVLDLGIGVDDESTMVEILSQSFEKCNIIVTSGGVSMGEKDLLKHVLVNHFEGRVIFGRVNMKPGKPTTFVVCKFSSEPKMVIALPGNPVSAFVTCHLFAIPAIKRLSGRSNVDWPRICVKLEDSVKLDQRPEYARAYFTSQDWVDVPTVKLTGCQISSRLISAAGAPLLVELPSSSDKGPILPKGSVLKALVIGNF